MQREKLNRNIIDCFFFPLFLGRVLHYTSKCRPTFLCKTSFFCRLNFCLSIFKLISRESITTIYYSTYDDVLSLTNFILNHLGSYFVISEKSGFYKVFREEMHILTFFTIFFHVLRFPWVSLAYLSWDISNDMSHMGFRRIFGTISLKNVFVEKPKLRLEYLSQDESGSLEIFTTDSVKDKEQNVRNKFSLEALSFFFP